jgi:hypothetical protein
MQAQPAATRASPGWCATRRPTAASSASTTASARAEPSAAARPAWRDAAPAAPAPAPTPAATAPASTPSATPPPVGPAARVCTVANGAPACNAGRCAVGSCAGTFGDCDDTAANGCETDLATSVMHCGTCGRACSFANATGACVMGACAVTRCNEGFADCDGNPANGCEVRLRDTASHCGACGTACARTNAEGVCRGGACALGACRTGFGDCDMNSRQRLRDAPRHTSPTAAPAAPPAPPPTRRRPASTAPAPSGAATRASPTATTARQRLRGRPRTSAASCGSCGNACNLANATASCVAGACAVARCNEGFADCDGNAANGCEVDLQSDALSCGACGRACVVPNAGAVCRAGRCERSSCNQNFADCDGDGATAARSTCAAIRPTAGRATTAATSRARPRRAPTAPVGSRCASRAAATATTTAPTAARPTPRPAWPTAAPAARAASRPTPRPPARWARVPSGRCAAGFGDCNGRVGTAAR